MLTAETVYQNGTIITMDDSLPTVSAVAVSGGRIIALGNENELKRFITPKTRLVDLKGHTMLPGFYDSHGHFAMAGNIYLTTVPLNSPPMGTIESIGDALDALKARLSKNPELPFLAGFGFDDTLVAEKRTLTIQELDSVSTTVPIIISHASGHVVYVNSKTLEIAGYDKNTPDPEGGRICKDPETGELNGTLEETAFMNLDINGYKTMQPKPEDIPPAIRYANNLYAKAGVTTANEGGVADPEIVRIFYESEKNGDLTIRVTLCPFYPTQNEADAIARNYGINSELVRVQGTKILQDGSIQAFTAHLSEPYYTPFQDKNDWKAYSTCPQEELNKVVKSLYQDGHQLVCHCNGDQALEEYLNAIEEAQKTYPRLDDRPIVIHSQTARYDQIKRMKKLNATPSFFTLHTYYWGDRHMDIFLGPNRGANISAAKWAEEASIPFSTHCDTPITPQTPLLSIWAAVNRETASGRPIGKHQAIDVWQALKSYTIDAAYQYYDEKNTGSIERGKKADFVVLDQNPLDCNKMALKDINVLETIVGDQTVFKSDKC